MASIISRVEQTILSTRCMFHLRPETQGPVAPFEARLNFVGRQFLSDGGIGTIRRSSFQRGGHNLWGVLEIIAIMPRYLR